MNANIYLVITPAPLPFIGGIHTPLPDPQDWVQIDSPDCFGSLAQDWQELRVSIDRRLSDEEIERVTGCIGYALREVLAGEELSLPLVMRDARQTLLFFSYDSTKSQRSDPDPDRAFQQAWLYVQQGTPLRSTDRAGVGTKGSRLVEGVGLVRVEFAVR